MLVPQLRAVVSRESLTSIIDRAGVWAPIVLASIMALAVVVSPVPSVPIAAVLGMAYGPWAGTAIAVAGAAIGAMAAFLIARYFGKQTIRMLTGRAYHFCNGCSEGTLSVVVFVARLIPVVSFDIVSYGAGLSRMSFWRFSLWTVLGMIPWTWFYTSVGSAVLDNPTLAAALSIVLALVILGAPVLVKRYNVFGLGEIISEQEEADDSPRAQNGS